MKGLLATLCNRNCAANWL